MPVYISIQQKSKSRSDNARSAENYQSLPNTTSDIFSRQFCKKIYAKALEAAMASGWSLVHHCCPLQANRTDLLPLAFHPPSGNSLRQNYLYPLALQIHKTGGQEEMNMLSSSSQLYAIWRHRSAFLEEIMGNQGQASFARSLSSLKSPQHSSHLACELWELREPEEQPFPLNAFLDFSYE